MSTRRPRSVTRMRPSWGSRRSAMFISAMILMREVMAAWSRRGRRLLVVEDAVDAVADAQRVLERLDVDVGGLGVDGVLDEEVDQPDDGRLERHVAQVVDVLVAARSARSSSMPSTIRCSGVATPS